MKSIKQERDEIDSTAKFDAPSIGATQNAPIQRWIEIGLPQRRTVTELPYPPFNSNSGETFNFRCVPASE